MSPAAIQRRAGVGQGSMYHHFAGKADLASAALLRNAEGLLDSADSALGGPRPPVKQVVDYLRRDRDPLLGCPVGRLAQDREVLADERLREIIDQLFETLQHRLCTVLGELPTLEPADEIAYMVLAVLQGGYVLARAAGKRDPFDHAINGAIRLLRTAAQGDEK